MHENAAAAKQSKVILQSFQTISPVEWLGISLLLQQALFQVFPILVENIFLQPVWEQIHHQTVVRLVHKLFFSGKLAF